ncbi:flagellar brake protein [Alicyclobacillus dauci]|uniref:PilZ domain-containing protein n=1 Tax=Alicyclobacillus dauci TaxID=1475485 RepID=A0ABY6Z986_9BACL|nr:PilZ domain-containing protein [Alicyclobacillus dauci]WAH39313.1 PilZ domain-containing protein [Alicyclobacillus dauci]
MTPLDEGQYIFLFVSKGEDKGRYDSRVQSIENGTILIDIPSDVNKSSFRRAIPVGTRLIVTFSVQGESLPYYFVSEVTQIHSDHLAIKYPTKIESKNLREFYRIPVNLNISAYLLGSPESSRAMKCVEVSGNGMVLETDESDLFQKDDKVEIETEIELHGHKHVIQTPGVILRISGSREKAHKTNYVVEFVGISEMDQEKVVQYVFDQQIKQHKMHEM